jgi:DUF971 family protein
MDKTMNLIPTKIEPLTPSEFFIAWTNGDGYALPYLETRYYCPCAGCVDEHTGQRTIEKSAIAQNIRPLGVHAIGRYAIQINWSDRHNTGMYHYDRLLELCHHYGRKIEEKSNPHNQPIGEAGV